MQSFLLIFTYSSYRLSGIATFIIGLLGSSLAFVGGSYINAHVVSTSPWSDRPLEWDLQRLRKVENKLDSSKLKIGGLRQQYQIKRSFLFRKTQMRF